MKVLLLLILVNAHTGQPVEFHPVTVWDSPQDCEEARTAIPPQTVAGELAKVFVCALPPQES